MILPHPKGTHIEAANPPNFIVKINLTIKFGNKPTHLTVPSQVLSVMPPYLVGVDGDKSETNLSKKGSERKLTK